MDKLTSLERVQETIRLYNEGHPGEEIRSLLLHLELGEEITIYSTGPEQFGKPEGAGQSPHP